MEVPIIIYSLLLIATLALNITARFVLREATRGVRGDDTSAPRGCLRGEGATPYFVTEAGETLDLGEQRLVPALYQGERELQDEMLASWVSNSSRILEGEP